MPEFLVSGYYGFQNLGDEAILAGTVHAFRALDPDSRFTFISGDPAATRRHGVEAVGRRETGAIWRALGRADVVLSGGGSLLQDVTSPYTIPYYLSIGVLGLVRRRPLVFFAQGVGPVRTALGRHLVRLVGNRASLITVRDDASADTLAALGVTRPPVRVTADAALALDAGDRDHGLRLLQKAGIAAGARPLIGVSVRPWKDSSDALRAALARSLDRLATATGGAVVFVPMQIPQDVDEAARVTALMRLPAVNLSRVPDHFEAQSVIAALDVMVGIRYHALLFAAMSRVPVVGISYDPKIDNFLRSLGMDPVGSTRQLVEDDVVSRAEWALQNRAQWEGRAASIMADLTQKARENARLVLDLVGRSSRRGG